MNGFQYASLLLAVVVGTGVVLTRDPLAQALSFALYGIVFSIVFMAFQAPDVALSQIVVGAVVLPLMVLFTLARIRGRDRGRDRG